MFDVFVRVVAVCFLCCANCAYFCVPLGFYFITKRLCFLFCGWCVNCLLFVCLFVVLVVVVVGVLSLFVCVVFFLLLYDVFGVDVVWDMCSLVL